MTPRMTPYQVHKGWLSSAVSVTAHLAGGIASMATSEALTLSPSRLIHVGRLLAELEGAGISTSGCIAIARALHLAAEPDVMREAFRALDLKGSGTLPMARVRRLLPALSRHLPPAEVCVPPRLDACMRTARIPPSPRLACACLSPP